MFPWKCLTSRLGKRFDTDGRLFWNMNTPVHYEEARRVFEERAGANGWAGWASPAPTMRIAATIR